MRRCGEWSRAKREINGHLNVSHKSMQMLLINKLYRFVLWRLRLHIGPARKQTQDNNQLVRSPGFAFAAFIYERRCKRSHSRRPRVSGELHGAPSTTTVITLSYVNRKDTSVRRALCCSHPCNRNYSSHACWIHFNRYEFCTSSAYACAHCGGCY